MLAWMYSRKLRSRRAGFGVVALALMIGALACGIDDVRHTYTPDGAIGPSPDAPGDGTMLAPRPSFEQSYKQGCASNADCANELTCLNNICDCCQLFNDDSFGAFGCAIIAPEAFVEEICKTRPVAVTGPAAASYLGGACDASHGFHQNCPPQLVCVRGSFADQCMCCDDTGAELSCATSDSFANAHCLSP